MKLNTKYHGVKEYEEKDIITFKNGLPGFPNLTKFIIFPVEENEIFHVLHSIEDKEVGIVVVTPFYFIKDYEFKLGDEKINDLKISSEEEVLVLTTVTLNSNIKSITSNLKAPIVINRNEHLGEQIILDNPKYSVKHKIIEHKL